jgi:hypothetical protein
MLPRKTVILAKIEAVYQTDPVPTPVANAILCSNLKITPLRVESEDREHYRAYLGNSEKIPVMEESVTEFDVEIAGAGAAATAPKYGPLLRACAHSETVTAADVTGPAQAGAAKAITLAAGASATDNAYLGMLVTLTGGTGSGQSRVIVGYNGTTKVSTVDLAWTTPPDATSVYAVKANVQYRPVSSGFEAVTIYTYRDGVLYEMNGVRGTVALEFNAKRRPVYKFRFIGIYVPVIDAVVPTTADFSGFQTPRPSIPTWTPSFSVHGYAAKVASISLDTAGDVQHAVWMNAESIEYVDRKPAGKLTVESVTVATKDYFAALRAVTLDAVALRHGSEAGNSVIVAAGKTQLADIEETEVNGVLGYTMSTTHSPDKGNDEYTITTM